MLIRFRQDVLNLWPKVVVILAGTNDIAGNTGPSTLEMIEDNIHSMAELAKAHGIQVVLCSVLPAYDYPWRTGLEPAPRIVELNKRLNKYAGTHGVVYCDFSRLWLMNAMDYPKNFPVMACILIKRVIPSWRPSLKMLSPAPYLCGKNLNSTCERPKDALRPYKNC